MQVATTPGEVEWTGADARVGRAVTFTFRLAGYRDYTVMRTIRSESIAVVAHLEEAPNAAHRTTTPPRTNTTVGAPRAHSEQFRSSPY